MFNRILSSQLRRNVASGVVAAGCGSLVALASYPIYICYLGLEVYGIWVVLAAIMQFAMLGDFGISHSTTKLVAEEFSKDNLPGVQRYVTSSLLLLGLAGSLALSVLWIAGEKVIGFFDLSPQHAEIVRTYLPWANLVAVYTILGRICNAALSGLGRMDLANYIQTAGRILGVATSTLLLAIGLGVESLLIGSIVNCVFAHAASVLTFRRISRGGLVILEWPRLACFQRVASFGGGVFSASLVSLALNPFNKLLLCKFGGVASVPIYDIAFHSALQVKGLAEAALRALIPEVSRLATIGSQEASERVGQLNRRVLKIMLSLSLPIYFVVLVMIKPLITLWLGTTVAEPLWPVVAVMLLASLASLISVPSYYTLLGIGQVRSIFVASVVKVATNVTICMGIVMVGATVSPLSLAFAVLVALSVTSLYLVSEIWRRLNPAHREVKHAVGQVT